jgi:hypothetical protein
MTCDATSVALEAAGSLTTPRKAGHVIPDHYRRTRAVAVVMACRLSFACDAIVSEHVAPPGMGFVGGRHASSALDTAELSR